MLKWQTPNHFYWGGVQKGFMFFSAPILLLLNYYYYYTTTTTVFKYAGILFKKNLSTLTVRSSVVDITVYNIENIQSFYEEMII